MKVLKPRVLNPYLDPVAPALCPSMTLNRKMYIADLAQWTINEEK